MLEPIPINALCPCCRTQTLRLVSVSRAECSSGAEGCPVIFDADQLERDARQMVKAMGEAQAQMHGQLRRERAKETAA